MKSLLIALALTSTAFAESPLIVKSSGSGFAPAEWSQGETCQVFEHEVKIEKHAGTSHFSYSVAINLDVEATKKLIEAAAHEEVRREENYLCDGPVTVITAMGTEAIELYSTGGCGTDKHQRDGAASYALKSIVNTFCPETH